MNDTLHGTMAVIFFAGLTISNLIEWAMLLKFHRYDKKLIGSTSMWLKNAMVGMLLGTGAMCLYALLFLQKGKERTYCFNAGEWLVMWLNQGFIGSLVLDWDNVVFELKFNDP